MKSVFLITCEHASFEIPAKEQAWFQVPKKILTSHRGWDQGAPEIAKRIAKNLGSKLILGTHTRLLVDLNRAAHHPTAFSEFSKSLPEAKKSSLVEKYHAPHWNKVRSYVEREIAKGNQIVHIGVHSFTPVMKGYLRPTDFGILYDPSRPLEKELCRLWQKRARQIAPYLQTHLNLPYRGTGNGLISSLRTEYRKSHYVGIELELNQRLLASKSRSTEWSQLITSVIQGE